MAEIPGNSFSKNDFASRHSSSQKTKGYSGEPANHQGTFTGFGLQKPCHWQCPRSSLRPETDSFGLLLFMYPAKWYLKENSTLPHSPGSPSSGESGKSVGSERGRNLCGETNVGCVPG